MSWDFLRIVFPVLSKEITRIYIHIFAEEKKKVSLTSESVRSGGVLDQILYRVAFDILAYILHSATYRDT